MQQRGLAHRRSLHLGGKGGQQEGVGAVGLSQVGKRRRVGRGRLLMCRAYDTRWTGRKLYCRCVVTWTGGVDWGCGPGVWTGGVDWGCGLGAGGLD